MAKKNDLYDSLGVDKNSSADEIKKAYRKKASENHPDKGGDNEKMTEITKAYSVLGNEKKRERYDATGQEQEEPFDRRFQEFIQRFLLNLIETKNVDSTDLIKELKKLADVNIQGTKNAKKECLARKKRFEKVLMRLEAKGENRIAGIIQMNVDNCKKEEGAYDDHLEFMGKVLECLDGYEYNYDTAKADENLGQFIAWNKSI